MRKSTLHFARTAHFSLVNETYSSIGNLQERISFRGMNIFWDFDTYKRIFPEKTMTREERIERYEWVCCEIGERPFHWTEERWQQHLSDVKSDLHTERCEANSWFN